MEFFFWRFRLMRLSVLVETAKVRQAISTVVDICTKYIDRSVERSATQKRSGKFNLVSSLVEQTSEDELRAQTTSMLFAGRDTTGNMLMFTLSLLARHPEVYQRLRETIVETFPEAEGATLDYTKLRSCRYLQHVFSEALRLYAVAPMNLRVAARDTIIPVGGGPDGKSPAAVKKGQQVLMNTYAMHRRKDL